MANKALTADYRNAVFAFNPLGYWRLGEPSGTNAADETNRHDGTYTNTPTLGATGALTGDNDTAVTFARASTEYVTMGDQTTYDLEYNDAFSITGWFKSSDTTNAKSIVSKMLNSGTFRGFQLLLADTGSLRFQLINTTSTTDLVTGTTDTTLDDGNWHHFVVTYSGNNLDSGVTFYVDGVVSAKTNIRDGLGANTILNAAALCIGARAAAGLPYEGTLDEIAIFPSELNIKDVASLYYRGLNYAEYEYEVLKLAPTSYWRLGESSGTTAVDEVGNYDGTYVGTPTLGATSLVPADGVNKAVTFLDSVPEYVQMGDNLEFAHDAPFSFCFWVNTTDTAGAYITKYNDLTPKGFTFHTNTSQVAFIWRQTVSTNEMRIFFNDSDALYDGNDHFVVVTYDGSTNASGVNFYLDGVLQPPTISVDTLSATPNITDVFCLATQRAGNNVPLNGTMDEVAVFLHELTEQEAHDLYTYGMTYRTDFSGYTEAMWEARPVGWWRLGEPSGTNAVDELGLNDGTYTNTPTLGVTGAISTDSDTAITLLASSSEYVTVGDVLDFDHDEPFSGSIWFKCTATSTLTLWSKQESASNFRGYALQIAAAGDLVFTHRNTESSNKIHISTDTSGWDDDVWHHCVVTYDGSTNASGVHIYVDGVDEPWTAVADTLSATCVTTAPLCIGSRNSTNLPFDGELDEFALFARELTLPEVRRIYFEAEGYNQYALAVLMRHAFGYWRLGDGGPTTAVDETGNQNATGVNTPVFSTAGLIANEPLDDAVDLERTASEYFTVGTSPIVSKEAASTIMAWVKFEDMGVSHRIWQEEDTVSRFAFFVDASDNLNFYVDHGTTSTTTGSTTLVTGKTYFLCATLGAGGQNVYINGVLDGTDANTSPCTATANKVSIGSKLTGGNVYFDGVIDEVAVLNEELTQSQINDIYFAALFSYGGEELAAAIMNVSDIAGATANHTVTDATTVAEILTTQWSKRVTETFNWEVGVGLITTISESFNSIDAIATVRNQIGAAVESVQFALTENIEHAKGVLEALATADGVLVNTILQGNLSENLTYADVIRLTWDQFQTDSVNVTDVTAPYAQKAAALAELFVAAGIADTIHKASALIAEAIILQDLVERYFELSVTDAVTLTDTDVLLYKAVVANIEAATMSDSLAGTRSLRLLLADSLVGSDEDAANAICNVLASDAAIFGGAISLPDGVFSAIVLNTESLGISEYTNYPFNSFGKLGTDYLGASDTDIYQLTGPDDAGTDIDAVIRTGMTNFGTNVFKRVPRAYLGYTSDGGLIMKTISTSGGVKTERWYELTPRTIDHASDAHAAARIKLGRGIKATYWQFELINKLGADFDIDMLQLYPMILSRRV